MNGHTLGIERSNARRRNDDKTLVRFFRQVAQEGGFSRTGLPGQENMGVGVVDKTRGSGY